MFNRPKTNILILFLISLAFIVTANAQNIRVYIAKSGDDANSCSATSPCKTITKGLSVVDAGGEIVITESGDYPKFNITKSVTVTAANGVNAAVISEFPYAIGLINLQQTDKVTIRNLTLIGGANPPDSSGISNISAGTLVVDNCVFTGFESAIVMSKGGKVFVHDTTIRNNLVGISLFLSPSEETLNAVIDNCKIELNDTGISVAAKVVTTIRNSVIANNTSRGIYVRSLIVGMRGEALIDNCHITGNTVGIALSSPNGTVVTRLSRSTITSNSIGVAVGGNATAYTLQNNVIETNLTNVSGAGLTPLQVK